jgi:hypothetical protein
LSPKFRHTVGQTYVYQFNGQTKTSVVGTSAEEALLQVNAQVWMTFRSACDVVVQLKETTVAGLDDKVFRPIRFYLPMTSPTTLTVQLE